ncbi:MAG: ABC transporter ATP-binding protein [Oscillospiraceae bacterium]|jgi:branched-chain amino acid transport system ATP-binding protein|nr:ABC transporter ATP-binding protein [Oscillospiraceae bacterium]
MLQIQDLTVRYGGITAVDGITMDIKEHETVALIGANGAGKTTTLHAVSGLLKAAGGSIVFDGTDITKIPAEQIVSRGVIQVPEGRQVFAKLTIEENLRLGAYLQKDKAKIKENYEKAMTLFPILRERRKQAAGTLSGGEQQMLAIGRALMGNPRLLLLDEPSMGLSPLMTQQVFDVLSELKAGGMTILLVEQNAYEALTLSDRAYIMESGNITLEGRSSELIDDPRVKDAYLGGDL